MTQPHPYESNSQDILNELQMFYDDAPCGYHSLDAEGRVIRVNNTELKMLGYSCEEMIGQKYAKFLTPESLEIFRANFPKMKRGKRFYDVEMEIIRKDGSILPISATVTPIRDKAGNFLMSRSIFVDISERKQLEKERQEAEAAKKQLEVALSSSEAKLRRILDNAIAAITSYRIFQDHTWEFEYWSPGCETILGYTAEELMADQNLCASRVLPEDLETILAYLFEYYNLTRYSNIEYRFRHKDGTLRWITSSQILEWDATNNCWFGTSVLTDITKRKQAEITLQEQLSR